MHSAPRADDTVLRLRVLLPLRRSPIFLCDSRHLRPRGPVLPVGVFFQNTVGVKHRFVSVPVHILAVSTTARPVHQSGRLEGRRVVDRHGRIDNFCNFTRHWFILVCGHAAIQRQYNPQPWSPRPVFSRGIDHIATAQRFHTPQDILRSTRRYIVGV